MAFIKLSYVHNGIACDDPHGIGAQYAEVMTPLITTIFRNYYAKTFLKIDLYVNKKDWTGYKISDDHLIQDGSVPRHTIYQMQRCI